MLSLLHNKQLPPRNAKSIPLEKEYSMRRNIQLHIRIPTSTPSEHCPKMPQCELIREDNLTDRLLEDIIMIVVIQEETSVAISVDEATVVAI
jgi:hypothetical protein